MKTLRTILALLCILLLNGNLTKAQSFDVYIANDFPTSSTVYEFDMFIRSTTSTTWAFRTIQCGFYVNPSWLPAGPAPTILYIAGSTGLISYAPGLIQMNASPSLSAFQIAANSAGNCGANTIFTSNGQTAKIGRFRITSNSGPMNCIFANISMIRPIVADVAPGGNVNLKMAFTKWTDPICVITTSTTISTNGSYTSVSGGTLLSDYNNMAPRITGPANFTTCEGGTAVFTVTAIPNAGQGAPTFYQWNDNGSPMSGEVSPTLTITNVSMSINGHVYTCTVTQCNSHTSNGGTLTVQPISDGDACTIDACNAQTGVITHVPVTINDNNVCTTDNCDIILGVTHTPVNMDDGNPLTTDACDPVTGVYHFVNSFSAIPYQAIARNGSGNVVSNQPISIRFSIREATSSGNILYREIHNVTTNSLGLFNVNIGKGTPVNGIYSSIEWAGIIKFLQVEMDIAGGNAFTDMGTQQMMSVPYALYAVKSGSKIAFNSYNTGSISLPSSTLTQVVFSASEYNYGNGFSIATGKFTAPEAGIYHFNTNINFNPPSGSTDAFVKYYKNGSQVTGGYTATNLSNTTNTGSSISFSYDLDLSQGDIIDVRIQQNSGLALNIYGGTTLGCTFSGFRIN